MGRSSNAAELTDRRRVSWELMKDLAGFLLWCKQQQQQSLCLEDRLVDSEGLILGYRLMISSSGSWSCLCIHTVSAGAMTASGQTLEPQGAGNSGSGR